jgi:hypothetical protein
MKKQSIIQAILDAIDETDGSIAKHMNQLIKWAKYCEKSIGSLNGYPFKAAFFTVTGSAITLPDDCYRVKALFLGNQTDKLNLRYADPGSRVISVDNRSDDTDLEYVWEGLSSQAINKVLWEEVGDILSLPDQFETTEMTVLYQYIQTDEKGYWVVNDSHIEAIKRYLIYMISKKFLFRNFKSSKMTRANDLLIVDQYKKDYSVAIRNARAEDGKESPLDTRG